MYTAKLKNRLIEGGKIRWVVEFTNGTDLFTESFNVNRYVDLQARTAERLAELNYVDTFVIDGTIDPTILVVTQTQAEIDRNTWLNDWRILKVADDLVSHGVILNTLAAYVAHKAKVTANFKVGYIAFL